MYSLNRAQIIGNLTRDPELKVTTGGQNVASFAIATNRSWNNPDGTRQDAVEYHDIVAWGKLAEIATQILAKGKQAYVEGRLQTRSWETTDGQKRQKTEIVADNLIALGGASRSEAPHHAGQGEAADNNADAAKKPAVKKSDSEPSEEINIDDIPF